MWSNVRNWVVTGVPNKNELSKYRAKRDFTKTAEPTGQTKIAASNRRRFIIQKHAATRLHYDLRLELDGVFKSWAVTRGPSLDRIGPPDGGDRRREGARSETVYVGG